MVTTRFVLPEDAAIWIEMRHALWPEDSPAEHRAIIERYLTDGSKREAEPVILAEDSEGLVLGFVELSIRPFAEGCRSGRVAYLEGWFVVPESRGQGIGRALLAAAKEWGRSKSCTELASDTDSGNEVSSAAHRALGFTDVGLVRCFKLDL